jgi:hypothetical protein
MNAQLRRLFAVADQESGMMLHDIIRNAAVERAVAHTLSSGESSEAEMKLIRGVNQTRELLVTSQPVREADQVMAQFSFFAMSRG